MGNKTTGESMKSVIVTTKHRGVFFGNVADPSPAQTELTLEDAVMVIYWGTTKGLGQLAATGPTEKSRLSAVVPKWHLRGVTSILECSGVAVDAFAERLRG